jgi:hypothetical protein
MVTIQSAQVYSTKGEMAYQINYSNGVSVRAVESADRFIRKEWEDAGRLGASRQAVQGRTQPQAQRRGSEGDRD